MASDKRFTAAVIEVYKEMLDENGVSYRDIEMKSGINRGTISRHLSGKHSLNLEALQELCIGAGLDTAAVLGEAYKRLK